MYVSPMKNNIFLPLSAVASGALLALALHLIGPQSHRTVQGRENRFAEALSQIERSILPAKAEERPAPAPQASAESTQKAIAAAQLSEGLTIIRGNEYVNVKLRPGTTIDVLGTDGPYLRIRYKHYVATIPRSCVAQAELAELRL